MTRFKSCDITPEDRNMLAVDLAPGDHPLALFKRAALLRVKLLGVAIVGVQAVRDEPVTRERKPAPRTPSQQMQTQASCERARDAAVLRRKQETESCA